MVVLVGWLVSWFVRSLTSGRGPEVGHVVAGVAGAG